MADALARMWPYWRDRKGVLPAITQQFQEIAAKDMRIQVAVAQILNAEAALDARFRELRIEQGDGEED